ncbi:MAG: type II toxin-antitoxin system HipA family toxin [Gemmatimonadales bacterium]|nr:type II toxin-antitoxin system HipA family toxin [Gemmatimonadales bacterium]
MPEVAVTAEVWIWKHFVGAVAETGDGQITFEYDPAFSRSGLEISPLMLPLSKQGPLTFPELQRLEAFAGLPGVLADALPDRFGNAVIRKYFTDRGRPDDAMRPVQKLLYVGKRAMGALEFRPPIRVERSAERESLEIAALVEQARVVIEGRPDAAIPEIMRVGASAGGARPKALVLWNRTTNKIRSGFAKPQAGDEYWIMKFDGVGELEAPDPTPKPFNRIEHAYSRLARDAGIDMPDTALLEERRCGHLMVQRFDRIGNTRLHLHSLGGLHHVDYNNPGQFSYEQFLRTILQLDLGYPALEEGFRRGVFNVVGVNQDDHVKNISFLMDQQGVWRLAPAYDLTYARGAGFTRVHQMTLNNKVDGFTRKDLLTIGASMGIKRDGADIIDSVVAAMGNWEKYARAAKVPADQIALIKSQHRLV